jgi:hypothetical protein
VFADGLYPERIDIGYEIISQSGTISDLAMEIDGHWFLFTDAFSPKELCWVWFIPLASEALLLAAVAIVMATIVVIVLENGDTIALDFPDWGFGTTSSSAIVNDISGRYKDGKLVGFTICGSTYSLKSEYEDVSDRLNGKHYFAFLSGPTVYVFPREIALDDARNVMLLDPNYNGKYSTYTVSQDDAYNAAYTHWGLPIQDSNRPTGSNGIYYMHYHTHDHATSGHSFYGQPLFDEPYPHV